MYELLGTGVQIELGFSTDSEKYSDLNWVQTITTNQDMKGNFGNFYYTDIEKGQKDAFYYDKNEMKLHRDYKKFDVHFYDNPERIRKDHIVKWSGELSLIGKYKGNYFALATFRYGFSITNSGTEKHKFQKINYKNAYKWLKKV